MNLLKKLTLRNWAWLHFKISLGVVWATLMAIFPPPPVAKALEQPLITIWMALTIMGVLTSIVGYVMSQNGGKSGVIGVSVELSGLSFFAVGPLIYFLTQVSLTVMGDWEARLALSAFAYSMCAVLAYRFVVVILRFRREAHDETKED